MHAVQHTDLCVCAVDGTARVLLVASVDVHARSAGIHCLQHSTRLLCHFAATPAAAARPVFSIVSGNWRDRIQAMPRSGNKSSAEKYSL